MTSRASRPLSLSVPPEIFSLGDEGADVVFRGVGVQGNARLVEDAQQVVLVAMEALEQAVERRIAGPTPEDAVELGAQERGLFRVGGELVLFQAAVEPPNHLLGDRDGVALLVVGGN